MLEKLNSLNYKKGLLRIWLVLSVIWMLGVIFLILNSNYKEIARSISNYHFCPPSAYQEISDLKIKKTELKDIDKKYNIEWKKMTDGFCSENKIANPDWEPSPCDADDDLAALACSVISDSDAYNCPPLTDEQSEKLDKLRKDGRGNAYIRSLKIQEIIWEKENFCENQEDLIDAAKYIFLPPLLLLILAFIVNFIIKPIILWMLSGFKENEVTKEDKPVEIKKEEHSKVEIDDKPLEEGKEKQSRAQMGINIFGGGMFYSGISIGITNSTAGLGAVWAIVLLLIGYYGSKLLVSVIWKKVTEKKARFACGIGLVVGYFFVSVLLAMVLNL